MGRLESQLRHHIAKHIPALLPPIRKSIAFANEISPTWAFSRIYRNRGWGAEVDSVSGPGSDLDQTAIIRHAIPTLFGNLGIRSILDAPCGDFYWMGMVELPIEHYYGADIVRELTDLNTKRYGTQGRTFMHLDLTKDHLPRVDLILCRDCLVHLSFKRIRAAISNFRVSGARYLLTTTFEGRTSNWDIHTGQWRPLNLTLPPFNWPPPLLVINEGCTAENGAYRDKCLGLWLIDDIGQVSTHARANAAAGYESTRLRT